MADEALGVEDDGAVDLLDEVRTELEQSSEDLERLTDRLREQTVVVERLEMLVAEVLNLLPTAAVVVDADGRIVAMSQGAIEGYAGMTKAALGEPVAGVISKQLADGIAAFRNDVISKQNESERRSTTGAGSWTNVPGAKVLALPSGWVLAVLEQ